MMHELKTIKEISDDLSDKATFVFRPDALAKSVNFFKNNFKAELLYAVKTNPERHVLELLVAQGINSFDVASIEEIKLVRSISSDAKLYFMHPIKPRYAIKEAYFDYGVRNFSLDSDAELNKILNETGNAKDLSLHVRLSIPNNFAELSLSEKFGVNLQDAPELLKKIRKHADKMGICFHVGSQCMHPDAYRIAIRMAAQVVRQSGIKLEYFNVGGGFPSVYPGMTPPDMKEYFEAIHDELDEIKDVGDLQLLAEPGRAIVAESASLIVRVDMRKGNKLYINDGTYGSLFDAGFLGFIFPVRLICDERVYSSDLLPFSFYGPTCDSLDYMKGPFYLPNDTDEGDMIEIGQMGAYGRTMNTGFNGFAPEEQVRYVSDLPLMTMYSDEHCSDEQLEIIAA
ncbi:MAG: ornithine decarboxylase [Alphaproteobacteria bacterium CG11_big_fil_rev_8_21_14_0_20_39_49]|nr:MAG: ornithine decarboxylase [Alphaproteobacteria bacterium CG11_big_fil_rev_8_21_14_0_20_39_49]